MLGKGPYHTKFNHDARHKDEPAYKEYESNDEIEYLQIDWVPNPRGGHSTDADGREYGYFQVTPMKGKITIGVIPGSGPPEKVTHLVPAPGAPKTALGSPLKGNDPYIYHGKGGTKKGGGP